MIPLPRSAHEEPQLRIARGARATEDLVLAHLDALLDESEKAPELLARSVRVIVPSRSLRLHLAARLVRRRGRSVAGIEFLTLRRLAGDVLARMNVPAPLGACLFPVLVQRAARSAATLRETLDAFENGYEALHGTVRDLFDAGLDTSVAEAMEERLAELGSTADPQIERARSIVKVTTQVADAATRLGAADPSSVLRRAAECVREDHDRAVGARAVIIYGFAEVTGVAADFIEALVRHARASAYLDEPPDPADRSRPDRGIAFTVRLRERLQGLARVAHEPAMPSPEARSMFRAAGAHSQARIVAARVRALLDRGVEPESIGIVARVLETVQRPLSVQLGRLGIPFACWGGDGSAGPSANRLRAFVQLLQAGTAASADGWLAARRRRGASAAPELRVGLRAIGCTRLADVAGLSADRFVGDVDSMALPVRRGLSPIDSDGEGAAGGEPVEGSRAVHRRLDGRDLRAAIRAANALVARFRDWPGRAGFDRHAGQLRDLLFRDLGWSAEDARFVTSALAALAADLPPGIALARQEFVLLVRRGLSGAGRVQLGGEGGGVQVLDATNARGRTFDHLFVIGLNRDAFPRQIAEDPLMPDWIRSGLLPVLPDIPVKRVGHDEERYLFAQLLSAADHVTLSWLVADDDGKPLAPSPLVERLLPPGGADAVALLGDPLGGAPLDEDASSLCTPSEHALYAGLAGARGDWSKRLPFALAEFGESDRSSRDQARVAGARRAILDELDPDLATVAGRARARQVGPYLGFIGGSVGPSDPRGALWITTLEAIAACPWQVFLRRLLRLEPLPDPLGGLPEVAGAAVGDVVHRVLETVARAGAGEAAATLAEAVSTVARVSRWPADASLHATLSDTARAAAGDHGLRLPGLHHVLVELALPFVEAARIADWSQADGVGVLGAEVVGEVPVRDARGETRKVGFKADRVDRFVDVIRVTDYKTGTPISTAVGLETRRKKFLERVAGGSALQAVAYALAGGTGVQGRYLFLRPDDAANPAEEFAVESSAEEFAAAFARAVRLVLTAHDAGAFFPRVVDAETDREPDRCAYCEMQEACVRGDSGARTRLVNAAAGARAAAGRAAAIEQAFSDLWHIARPREQSEEDRSEGRE